MSNITIAFRLLLVTLLAVAGALSLAMLPPIAPDLMRLWSIGTPEFGMLLSAFSVTGLVLAIPGAIVIQKIGVWASGLVALVFLVVGLALGLISSDLGVQMVSRVLLGTGQALGTILAPTLIGQLVPPKNRALAMGLFTTSMPIAMIVMFNTGPFLVEAGGWRLPWLLIGTFVLTLVPFWAWGMRGLRGGASTSEAPRASVSVVLGHPVTLQTSVVMFLMVGAFMTLQLFTPTFLVQARGFLPAEAGSLGSYGAITGLMTGILGGLLSDRFRNRRALALGGLALLAILLGVTPLVSGAGLVLVLLLTGIFPALISINLMTRLTETVHPAEHVGLSMGLVTLGQNAGMMVGPLVFGAVVGPLGWTVTLECLAIVAAGAFCVLLVGRRG